MSRKVLTEEDWNKIARFSTLFQGYLEGGVQSWKLEKRWHADKNVEYKFRIWESQIISYTDNECVLQSFKGFRSYFFFQRCSEKIQFGSGASCCMVPRRDRAALDETMTDESSVLFICITQLLVSGVLVVVSWQIGFTESFCFESFFTSRDKSLRLLQLSCLSRTQPAFCPPRKKRM